MGEKGSARSHCLGVAAVRFSVTAARGFSVIRSTFVPRPSRQGRVQEGLVSCCLWPALVDASQSKQPPYVVAAAQASPTPGSCPCPELPSYPSLSLLAVNLPPLLSPGGRPKLPSCPSLRDHPVPPGRQPALFSEVGLHLKDVAPPRELVDSDLKGRV